MAELALAVVGCADVCLRYGRELVVVYKDFKAADQQLQDKLLQVEAAWSRVDLQLEFTKSVAESLGEEHCRIYTNVISRLNSILMAAVAKIEAYSDGGNRVKRLKFAAFRTDLDRIFDELERWQRIFDPTWLLVMRISKSTLIDVQLNAYAGPASGSAGSSSAADGRPSPPSRENSNMATAKTLRSQLQGSATKVHVNLPDEDILWDEARAIRFSSTRIVNRKGKPFLADSIACDACLDVKAAREDAEALAKKLTRTEPNKVGLPTCYGIVKRKDPETRKRLQSMALIFPMPPGAGPPSSLRQRLLESRAPSLSNVLGVARLMARAVSYIHTYDFVHKNIRPETILLFPRAEGPDPDAVCLFGFDSFRSVNFQTLQSGDGAFERNLYRHPSRQGFRAQERYVMQHDVYSLGVCLLELALWSSFVDYTLNPGDAEGDETSEDKVDADGKGGEAGEGEGEDKGKAEAEEKGDDAKEAVDWTLSPSKALGLEVGDFEPRASTPQSYAHVKDHLVRLAQAELPSRVGDMYASVVVTCLTCLDKGNDDFGDEADMRDDDGILIGVRFIEKVLLRLNEIVC